MYIPPRTGLDMAEAHRRELTSQAQQRRMVREARGSRRFAPYRLVVGGLRSLVRLRFAQGATPDPSSSRLAVAPESLGEVDLRIHHGSGKALTMHPSSL